MRFTGRWVVGAVLLHGLFLTQTRSVWFAPTVVLVVWAQRKVSLVRIGAVLLVLALLGLGTVDLVTRWFGLNQFSGDLRMLSVINGIRAGMENPVLDQVMPYNLFVAVFAAVGLPAALLLLLFLEELLRRLAPRRATPLLFTVGVLAMSLVEMTLYAGSMLTVLFFTYAGMGLGPDRPRERGSYGTWTRGALEQPVGDLTRRAPEAPAAAGAGRGAFNSPEAKCRVVS